ncbi:glycosyltransferase [Oceanicella actignis]|uniref:glycosyltransferase n=1 Tax=Oceanicella actignis TaxID=1189325 RepID=UPI0011E73075|nr:glycosyltransferase [Oceanicella actignis]TYO90838.1 GT2 family glycosyltransferase [Oceanicella actignis]
MLHRPVPSAPDPEAMPQLVAHRLIAPDPLVNTEPELFCRHDGGGGYDTQRGVFFVGAGGRLSFDAYFNVFDAAAHDLGPEDAVETRVEGAGRCVATLVMARPGRSWETLARTRLDLAPDRPATVALPPLRDPGLVFWRFEAIDDLSISQIAFAVRSPRLRDVRVQAVITTFKRDEAVQATCRRLGAYMARNPDVAERFRLMVVDNGGDTHALPMAGARLVRNRNLGGAGGFARGLLEARAEGWATHVLFMDDDAEFFPESLRRTIAVLSLARSPDTAVSGAMIPANHRWKMWENGAVFDRLCRPLDHGLDLRRFDQVLTASRPRPALVNRYGAWWYFCFPIDHVRTMPFPFFVRGDDIHFSLANRFRIRSVSGIASHQEDFTTKRSPLTLYLDTRNHVVQHLTHPTLSDSLIAILEPVWHFFRRANDSYHYATARAVVMAVEDLLRGPAMWDEDPDMARTRARIGALGEDEKVRPDFPYDPARMTPIRRGRYGGPLWSAARFLTGNGHLLPRFLFHRLSAVFPLEDRGGPADAFVRPSMVMIDPATGAGYEVRFDRRRWLANELRFARALARLVMAAPQLRRAYAQDGAGLTSEQAWRRRLGLEAPASADRPAQPAQGDAAPAQSSA